MDTAGLAANDPAITARREPFVFFGTGREYFGIWIVNVLLTIVTFGIYSAWAKVRRNRYFYGNTVLAGRAFEYHATPAQILIGRVIVFGVLILYNGIATVYPLAAGVLTVGFFFVIPYFVQRGLRFSARVTSYRNVRFDFAGGYLGAFLAFIVGGLVAVITLGILAPLASRWTYGYLFRNLTWGGRPFSGTPPLPALYRVWLLPAMITLIGLAIVSGLAILEFGLIDLLRESDQDTRGIAIVVAIQLAFLSLFLVYGLATLLYTAGVRNVAYSAVTFDGRHRLESTVGRWRYTWIAISNVIVSVLSLGLLRPWAAVRMARYLAASTAVLMVGDMESYFSRIQSEGAAIGSEFMDMEGFDVGF